MPRGVNKVILIGNLGADPETRYTASGGAITSIRIATSESWKDKQTGEAQERTEWHRYDGRTYLAIRVPDGSDLSCLALRRDALDAAMQGPQHSEDREENGDA